VFAPTTTQEQVYLAGAKPIVKGIYCYFLTKLNRTIFQFSFKMDNILCKQKITASAQ